MIFTPNEKFWKNLKQDRSETLTFTFDFSTKLQTNLKRKKFVEILKRLFSEKSPRRCGHFQQIPSILENIPSLFWHGNYHL